MRRIVLMSLMTFCCSFCRAQMLPGSEKNRLADCLLVDLRVAAQMRQHDATPMAFQTRLGWKVARRLGIYGHYEADYAVDKGTRGMGSYTASNSIGGGLQWKIIDNPKTFLPLTLHATVGTTVGNYAWKYTLYDVGLTMGLQQRGSIQFGIGYRLMDSRSTGFSNFNGIYCSLGFGL